eukprot:258660-Prymnesium_polylepis.1
MLPSRNERNWTYSAIIVVFVHTSASSNTCAAGARQPAPRAAPLRSAHGLGGRAAPVHVAGAP